MKKCICLSIIIVLFSASSSLAMQAQEKRIVYSVPGMDKVQARKNLTYKRVGGTDLKMDVYAPPGLGNEARLPAVIFISGGVGLDYEPKPKDWPGYISWGELIAASGMVAITYTHRLSYPKRQYEEGASDLLDLIAHLRTNGASLNIDGDRLCLIAFSGGGAMLSIPLRDRPEYIRCLIGFYTFLDTSHVDRKEAGASEELIQAVSPLRYLSTQSNKKIPPMFIARAGKDQIPAVNESIDRFIRTAIEQNISLDFANHPEGVHGFDTDNDTLRTREIIARAIAFMKTHLRVD